MKFIVFKKRNRLITLLFGLILVVVLVLNVAGYYLDIKYVSVFAAMAETNKYEVRSQLLMEAMNSVGVCKPEKAAEVWANGLKARSAAMQYSVMTKALKSEYAKQLEKTFPNWVTGVSSPWVDSFELSKTDKANDNSFVYQIKFHTKTSSGPAGDYNAKVAVASEGDFWRITKIDADKELAVYTGFIVTNN